MFKCQRRENFTVSRRLQQFVRTMLLTCKGHQEISYCLAERKWASNLSNTMLVYLCELGCPAYPPPILYLFKRFR